MQPTRHERDVLAGARASALAATFSDRRNKPALPVERLSFSLPGRGMPPITLK
jgi:hypothetical protein